MFYGYFKSPLFFSRMGSGKPGVILLRYRLYTVGRDGFGWEAPLIQILCRCVSACFSMVSSDEKSLPCHTFSLPLPYFETWDLCVLRFCFIVFFFSIPLVITPKTQPAKWNAFHLHIFHYSSKNEWVHGQCKYPAWEKRSKFCSVLMLSVHPGYNQLSLPLL